MSLLIASIILLLWVMAVLLLIGMLRVGAEADRQTEIAFQTMLREQESRSQHAGGVLNREEGMDGEQAEAASAVRRE